MEILNGEGRDRAARAPGENDAARIRAPRLAAQAAGTAALARSLGLLSGIAAVLGAGGVIAGVAGLISAGVLVLIGIPVAGFTRNQWMATSRGLQFAESVADVEALKRSDAFAFAQPIAAIRRRPLDENGETPVADGSGTPEPFSLLEPAGQGVLGPVGSTLPAGAAPGPRSAAASQWASGAPNTFWDSLSGAERARLTATARTVEFPPEAVVWRRGEIADHVILLQAGWTKIYGGPAGMEQIIAIRGPGDLIGERAALHRSSRSATVVTMGAVRGLFITTEQFSALVAAHPDLLGVMEEQVYQRLSGAVGRRCSCEPGTAGAYAGEGDAGGGDGGGDGDGDGDGEAGERGGAGPPSPASLTAGALTGGWVGQNCSVLFTDIAGFGSHLRSERDRRVVRRIMYEALREACEGSGVAWGACHREDRGDGALLVVPPGTPTGLIIHPMVSRLAEALGRHNRRAGAAVRVQLRVALHVGPVVSDAEGVTGDVIVHAARLLEASALKRWLAAEGAPVGFITSGFVYDAFLKRGSGHTDGSAYRRFNVRVKETKVIAWARLVGAGHRDAGAESAVADEGDGASRMLQA